MAAYDISQGKRRIGPTTGLAADLARRLEETGRPIRVGLIGSGEMGTDIVTQCEQMTGITVAAIAEINLDCGQEGTAHRRARRGQPSRLPRMRSSFAAALEAGKTAITQDAQLVCISRTISTW